MSPQEQKSTSPRARYVMFVLVTIAGVMAFTVGAGELALRMLAPQPASWLDIYQQHPTLPSYTLLPNLERRIDTGETRWTVYTDAQGYRTSHHGSETLSAQQPLALVLGDSFAFAHGVDYGQSFVALLDRMDPPSHRFLNVSVPGHGPIQYRMVLEHELQRGRQPSLVLVSSYLGNDLHDCLWDKNPPIHNGVLEDRGDLKSTIKRVSHLYRLVSRFYHVLLPPSGPRPSVLDALYDPKQWEPEGELHEAAAIYERELSRIADVTRAAGARPLVLLIPPRPSVEAARTSQSRPGMNDEHPVEAISALLRRLDLDFVDITKDLAARPTEEIYFAHDGHLTPLGHRITSAAIRRAIDKTVQAAQAP